MYWLILWIAGFVLLMVWVGVHLRHRWSDLPTMALFALILIFWPPLLGIILLFYLFTMMMVAGYECLHQLKRRKWRRYIFI